MYLCLAKTKADKLFVNNADYVNYTMYFCFCFFKDTKILNEYHIFFVKKYLRVSILNKVINEHRQIIVDVLKPFLDTDKRQAEKGKREKQEGKEENFHILPPLAQI